MSFYLAIKEVLHNKGRFLLIALIVALITTLVLFIAALAEGLGSGNREVLTGWLGLSATRVDALTQMGVLHEAALPALAP